MSAHKYSYAQNFEDVYIWRAFSDLERGFYIDIGAFHADIDSVTKFFYEKGWSGINVEPGPTFDGLSASRPRDINLKVAISDEPGSATLYYHDGDPGTSTLLSTLHERLENRVGDRIETTVEALTLEALFEAHVGERTVQFLKIDIEGLETRIIGSTDWNRWRPELIIVEATLPYSNVRQDKRWNKYFRAAGYHLVFFDGINTYYLREESLHRRHAFDRPVNVLDGFSKFDEGAQAQIAALQDQVASQMSLSAIAQWEAARELEAVRAQRDEIEAALGNANAFGARVDSLYLEVRTELEEVLRRNAVIEAEKHDLLENFRVVGGSRSLRASLLLGRVLRRIARRVRRLF